MRWLAFLVCTVQSKYRTVRCDCLLFMSHSRIFCFYGDVTIAGEDCIKMVLKKRERERSLLCHVCCDTGPWFLWPRPKVRSNYPQETTALMARSDSAHGSGIDAMGSSLLHTNFLMSSFYCSLRAQSAHSARFERAVTTLKRTP